MFHMDVVLCADEDWIYWVDEGENTISRIKRDLTQRELVVPLDMLGVEGLAVDWVAG